MHLLLPWLLLLLKDNLFTLKFHKKLLNQVMCLGQSVSRLVCVFHILFFFFWPAILFCDLFHEFQKVIQLGPKEVSKLNLIWNEIHRVCGLDWNQIRSG